MKWHRAVRRMPFGLWSIDTSWYVIIIQQVGFSRASVLRTPIFLGLSAPKQATTRPHPPSAHCTMTYMCVLCMAIINKPQIFCSLANTKKLWPYSEKIFYHSSKNRTQAAGEYSIIGPLKLNFGIQAFITGKYLNPRTIKAVFLKEWRQSDRHAKVN